MFIVEFENLIRLGCFAGVLVLLAVWELLVPRRRLSVGKPLRWLSNFGLVFLNTLLLRLVLPLGAMGAAVLARGNGWGLFNNTDLPDWLMVVLSVIALDLLIYVQHVMFHALPLFWRFHRVHHADRDVDVSTGLRFHTVEIIISMWIKMGAVFLLGAPVLGVVIFEVLLNATAMFNHANVRLPLWLDGLLRLAVVTPDMHRVHHSAAGRETNSNYGFNIPWWDYLFGTYRAQPKAGHEKMTIGLNEFHDERANQLHWMLLLPFFGLREQFKNTFGARSHTSPKELQSVGSDRNDGFFSD